MIRKYGFPSASTLCMQSSTAQYRAIITASRPTRLVATRWKSTKNSSASSAESADRRWTYHANGIFSTCYIPSPSTTEPSAVIEKLPRLLATDPRIFTHVLFLVTPGLAKWFGRGSSFLQDAMNHVVSPILTKTSLFESCVAVVDAMPAPEHFQAEDRVRAKPCPPLEGIAINVRAKRFAVVKKAKDSTRPSVLHVRSSSYPTEMNGKVQTTTGHLEDTDTAFSIVTIPLANTLFINGLRNTAFNQTWQATGNNSFLHPHGKVKSVESIFVATIKNDEQGLDHNVPLYPLTPAREVLSSMGNVIREVRNDDGKPLKASAELEAVVPKLLAEQKELDEEAQIQIFAKVMPPRSNDAAFGLDESPASPTFKGSWDTKKASYPETLATLYQQGRFYRVTSGGGGWGKKAGLLSLEPATNFAPLNDSETSMFPDPDKLDNAPEAASGVGGLVPAGHSIQFFAARVQQAHSHGAVDKATERDYDSAVGASAEKEPPGAAPHQIVIGTIPSSDTIRSPDATDAAEHAPPFVLPNCFGALSEGGASVSCKKLVWGERILKVWSDKKRKDAQYETVNEFRIDVSNATFKISLPVRSGDPD